MRNIFLKFLLITFLFTVFPEIMDTSLLHADQHSLRIKKKVKRKKEEKKSAKMRKKKDSKKKRSRSSSMRKKRKKSYHKGRKKKQYRKAKMRRNKTLKINHNTFLRKKNRKAHKKAKMRRKNKSKQHQKAQMRRKNKSKHNYSKTLNVILSNQVKRNRKAKRSRFKRHRNHSHRRMRRRPFFNWAHNLMIHFLIGGGIRVGNFYYRDYYCDRHYCYYYNQNSNYDDYFYCDNNNVCHYCNDYSCYFASYNGVVIKDKNLENCIRDTTGIIVAPLRRRDLVGLTELTCSAKNIQSIDGIEYLPDLKYLDISKNCVDDFLPLKYMEIREIIGINTQHPSFCR